MEATRERILEAARRLVVAPAGFANFTVDAVAREAGVSRMTVYNQFASRARLLEATFERIRTLGRYDDVARAWEHADPLDRLTDFVVRVGRMWGTDRVLFQRLYALAALDPDFARVLQPRMERRRTALAAFITALHERYGTPPLANHAELGDLLYAIVSFNTFEALARDGRSFDDAVPAVLRLAREAIGAPLAAEDAPTLSPGSATVAR